MTGRCETCDRLAELFQLDKRNDLNCSECNQEIQTSINLFNLFTEIEKAGGDVEGLETLLERSVNKLFIRGKHNLEPRKTPSQLAFTGPALTSLN